MENCKIEALTTEVLDYFDILHFKREEPENKITMKSGNFQFLSFETGSKKKAIFSDGHIRKVVNLHKRYQETNETLNKCPENGLVSAQITFYLTPNGQKLLILQQCDILYP